MKVQQNLDPVTAYLQETLVGYDVIPANFGWHIHKKDTYYGVLEYQETIGWQGEGFSPLPSELKEELKKFTQASSPITQFAA